MIDHKFTIIKYFDYTKLNVHTKIVSPVKIALRCQRKNANNIRHVFKIIIGQYVASEKIYFLSDLVFVGQTT